MPPAGKETIADLLVVRTLHFDEIIESAIGDVAQFVVLGAGFDTRPYGSLRRDGLRWLEVDQEATQKVKIGALARAGIDARHVTFVTADFAREDALARLREAGFDPTRRTLFPWEGVTMYLSEEAVRTTLEALRESAPPGSVLVVDLYGRRLVDFASKWIYRKTLEYTGEALTFGLPFESEHEQVLDRFVASARLRMGQRRFLAADHRRGPYGVVAEVRV